MSKDRWFFHYEQRLTEIESHRDLTDADYDRAAEGAIVDTRDEMAELADRLSDEAKEAP